MLRGVGLFVLTLCLTASIALCVYASVHYHVYWCLGAFPLIWIVAFYLPHVCWGYYREMPDADQWTGSQQEWKQYREFGFMLQAALYCFSYAVPAICWAYINVSPWYVVFSQISVSAILWAYFLWIKLFAW